MLFPPALINGHRVEVFASATRAVLGSHEFCPCHPRPVPLGWDNWSVHFRQSRARRMKERNATCGDVRSARSQAQAWPRSNQTTSAG
jgi:hypothetical protein